MTTADRRSVLRGALAAAGGIATAGVAAGCSSASSPSGVAAAGLSEAAPMSAPASAPIAFRGAHQAGVTTPPQPYAAWVGLDLTPGADRDSCQRLLRVWTDDIERLMSSQAPLTDQEPELAHVPSRLTVTVGVGPGFYQASGMAARRPSWLAPLPAFPEIDKLEPAWGQTDLVLQVCADSPVAVSHAVRRLVVGADTLAVQRWVQRGFREPLVDAQPGLPFRNLFGQVDGTVQPATDGTADDLIWVGASGASASPAASGTSAVPGLAGGSAMVIRRIAMNLDVWDQVDRAARESAIGRRLGSGAPLTGRRLTDAPNLAAKDASGFPVIDDAAHMRRAMPTAAHERILRRPYSYDDPPAAGERSNSGLVFVAFCADPVRQFVPIQRRLAELDLLNLWTTPIGSAVYAVLPGAEAGESLGHVLLSG